MKVDLNGFTGHEPYIVIVYTKDVTMDFCIKSAFDNDLFISLVSVPLNK